MHKDKFDEDNPGPGPRPGDDKIPYESHVSDNDMKQVEAALKTAQQNGLLVEVVTWALYAQSADPDMTPGSAMACGLYEWDC